MLIVLAGASLVLAGACSGDDEPTAYGEQTESDWNKNCDEADLDEATCGCFYDAITETVPFEEFKELDQELADNPSAELPPELETAFTTCVTGDLTTP